MFNRLAGKTTLGVAALLFAFVLGTRQADAQEAIKLRLAYEAGEACPPSEVFVRQVLARTNRAQFTTEDYHRTFSVKITKTDNGYEGVLDILSPSGKQLKRSMDGIKCEDVVEALALVGALSVDPAASTAPASDLGSTPPPAPKPPVSTAVRPQPSPLAPAVSDRWSWHWDTGVGVAVTKGPAPVALVGPQLYAQTLWRDSAGSGGSARLGVLGASTGILSADYSLASFQWIAGRAELCPRWLRATRGLWVTLCATTAVGAVRVKGTGAPVVLEATRAWVAPGVSAGLRWDAGRRWFVEISAEAFAILTRGEWVFEDPFVLVYRPGVVGYAGQIGVGWNLF